MNNNNNKKTKKKRHNGEGSIRQKPNGRYEVRISGRDMETGKSTRISKYADTLDEAVDIQHALSVAMVQTPQYLQNNTTVGEWLDNWLTTYMQHTLKQSTYKSYETYVRKHFKPSLGTIKLKELTPRTLQIFYNYKQEQENLSPKTISNLNMCLHKALAQAQSEGLILSNPSGSVSLPPLIKPHIEVLTREQQARLVQASYQFRYGVFVRMTLVTGLRLGEVVGLRWCDIDFYTNMLHVNQTLNRLQRYDDDEADSKTEIVTQTPKSQNSIRSIPMLPELVMDLQNWRTVQMQDAAAMGTSYFDSGLIATQENGLYVEPRLMREYYQKMLAAANLPNYNFHALRHTFATRAMEQGMDAKTLSILLGHYSVGFTLDTYAHVLTDQKWTAMQTMANMYNMEPPLRQPIQFFGERNKAARAGSFIFLPKSYSNFFSNRSIFSYRPAESIPSIKGNISING